VKGNNVKKFVVKNKYALGITLLIILTLLIGLSWLRSNPPDFIVNHLLERTVTSNGTINHFEKDALYVVTTGTGAPMPDPSRVGPQVVVVANGQKLVFDTGPGSTRNIEISQIGVGEIDAVFLTHYHSDHIGDLGELFLKRWGTEGLSSPLPVYGPPGVDKVVEGFELAYELDKGYRVAHHGEETMPSSGFGGDPIVFDLGKELTSSNVVYQQDGVEVVAFNVDHSPVFPAVGYRVNYKDRSVIISGDTIYTESLVEHAKDADLLVSEVLNHDLSQLISDITEADENNASEVAEDILDYHISPEQVGMWATKSGVSHVLATHILPPVPVAFLENPFLKDLRDNFKGPVRMANDGTLAIMPVDSDDINYKELIK
jgi:ribonuclease Z